MTLKRIAILSLVMVFSGCAVYAGLNYNTLYGEPHVQERAAPVKTVNADYFLKQVKPIIDHRCVVCHACYDAPCQLKLSSPEGIDRGGNKIKVYEGTRLTATTPTRLFEDAQTTGEWRNFGFHPVLSERLQTPNANIEAGLMARLLKQKQNHPLPQQDQLEGFDFSIDREQQCPTIEDYANYEQSFPNWGMPFGMPELTSKEHLVMMAWLQNGAKMNAPIPLTPQEYSLVQRYESLFNRDDLKVQLAARYIYEHLFLADLYFSELPGEPRFFKLVRSSTPPGQAVKRITTRRPYDDPGIPRVYYRLIPMVSTMVDKTHMPYALNSERLANWKKWFVTSSYSVTKLPGYEVQVAANPMTAFNDLPVKARFKFILDNVQNTIMAFIKGPVCRGQLALNVINDRFWVFFLDPDKADIPEVNAFYHSQEANLRLPAEQESNALPLTNWVKYSRQQARYLQAKSDFTNQWFKNGANLTTDVIWDGNKVNPNAALTVFRHYDSASVVQGLVGGHPKTAWVLDYALLERIHYLLVAGFDVYGNFGHQLITRMFMDFLRLEGESNFISLLPNDIRHKVHSSWYKDQSVQFSNFMQRNVKPFSQPSQVRYQTDDPVNELFDILQRKVSPVLSDRYSIVNTGLSLKNERLLDSINQIRGEGLLPVPQIMMIMIQNQQGTDQLFSLLHNNAHTNISSLFDEESNRDPANDDLTLVRGVLGSYPAAYLSLKESEVPELVSRFRALKSNEDYVRLLDRFAIRRSSPSFWAFSDKVLSWYKQDQPLEYGLLDYNRFENR